MPAVLAEGRGPRAGRLGEERAELGAVATKGIPEPPPAREPSGA